MQFLAVLLIDYQEMELIELVKKSERSNLPIFILVFILFSCIEVL